MNALTGIWMGLDTRRRAFLVGGLAALAVVLMVLIRLIAAPDYALLYSGLDPAAAGDVITAIEARGIAYRVQGDAIHVNIRDRDALRMSLAGEGLPATGTAGYELLDSLSGFGTTSQMFDAAYWRAKEGELARTISASPHIRAARVHLANPGSDPFQPEQDVTASVAIRPATGGLGPGHAQALRYLVASSVQGLLPENVTVVDADSGQVLGSADRMSPNADAAGRAEQYRRNIERLLAARVGPGNAVVQVSVQLTSERETIIERRIDPESRVIVSTDTEEREDTSTDGGAAGVTVASNLPDGDGAEGGTASSSQTSETRERVTFDLSETQREIARMPGDVAQISVAVLLNGVTEIGADGIAQVVSRPPEEIAALEQLVQSAIGFSAERGDRVTIESMAFDAGVAADLGPPGLTEQLSIDLGRVLQVLMLSAVAVLIALGLLRPLLLRAPAIAEGPAQPPEAQRGQATALPPAPVPSASSEPALGDGSTPVLPMATDAIAALPQPLSPLPAASAHPQRADQPDPVERLRTMIEEREAETIEILRSWMDEEDEVRP